MRYFHNFYGIFQLTEKVGLTVGFDYGVEEESPETSSKNSWYSAVVIAQFVLSNKVALAVRGEYYNDEKGIIVPVPAGAGTLNGFKTTGISANFDYQVRPNAVWRFEVRSFASQNEIFAKEGEFSKTSACLSTSLAIRFQSGRIC